MTNILEQLSAPFPPEAVRWRVGPMTADKKRGMALAYIDARDVMDRLDAVCGSNWSCRYIPMNDGTMCCEIGIFGGNDWIWRGGGAPPTGDVRSNDYREVEMALKGGYSDAFKRAAVLWGVGRYLYDLDSPWVALDERKQILPGEQAKLQKVLADLSKKQAAKPADVKGEWKQGTERSRLEGEWKGFLAAINAAIPGGRNAVDKLIFEQSATTDKWPEKWRSAYNERIAEARSAAHQAEGQDAA